MVIYVRMFMSVVHNAYNQRIMRLIIFVYIIICDVWRLVVHYYMVILYDVYGE